MLKIRKGIFETNSSSMHSFVLNKKGKWSVDRDSFEPHIKKGVLTIDMDEENGSGLLLCCLFEEEIGHLFE